MFSNALRFLAVVGSAVALAAGTSGVAVASAAATATTSSAPLESALVTGAPSDPGPLQGPPCPQGYLCVFEGAGFTGPRLDLTTCSAEPVDLRPTFGRSMGSFVNNQTGDQVAEFFSIDDAGRPVPAFSSTAVDARPDTSGVGVYFAKPC